MKRRTAILAALCIAARETIGQTFGLTIPDSAADTTVLEFIVIGENIKAFKMHYKSRTATVSMDEVMDALGATTDKP